MVTMRNRAMIVCSTGIVFPVAYDSRLPWIFHSPLVLIQYPPIETWVLYWIHSFWGPGGDIWQNRRMRILSSAIRRRGSSPANLVDIVTTLMTKRITLPLQRFWANTSLVRWISPMHCPWLGAPKLVAPFLPNLRSTRPQKINIPIDTIDTIPSMESFYHDFLGPHGHMKIDQKG